MPEAASGRARFHAVNSIACCRLLGLRVEELLMSNNALEKRRVLRHHLTDRVDGSDVQRTSALDDGFAERRPAIH